MYLESRIDNLFDKMSGLERKLDEISQRFREWNTLTKRWLTTKEACQVLKCSPRFLQYLRKEGKLNFSKINGKILISMEDIEQMIDENKATSIEE